MALERQDDRSSTVREIEFDVSEATYPFVSVSEAIDCRIDLMEIMPREDGRYAEFFSVTGTESERFFESFDSYDDIDVRLLSEYDRGGLFEIHVADWCPAVTLAELGALPRIARGSHGNGLIVAEVPPQSDEVAIVDTFLDEFPAAELAAKRDKDGMKPLFSRTTFRQELHSVLTERQREVLEAAFDAGYYDWPRECSGEDVADELGISSPTFSQHIHAAERKLLGMLYSDERTRDRSGGR